MTDREPSKASEPIQQSLANRETVAPFGLEDSTPTGSGPFNALPSQFGRYRVTKLLGYGAMGTVYLAFDPELNREVALKIPKADLARDPALWERFQREARATGDLNFPSICGMYEVGQIDGTHYISMQYIDGRPLSEFVSDNQAPRKVAGVVRKLALGLAHAHERGIVHRDLKPANVMIDTQGDPVIMDFGLARRLEMGGDVRATQSGMIVGSPAYMSPEQAKAEHDQIGPRTDIYGLGVLFFELLTGSLPFRGPMVVVLGQIATQPPPKPSSLRADVDPRLESLCLKMLEKQPQHRPASMTEVAQTLTDWLKGGGSSPEIALREAASPTESVSLTPAKPAAPPRTVKADGIEAQKQRVTDLLDKREYGAAIELLDKIVNLRDERFAPLVAWAKPKLKEVRATEQNVRQASAPSCDTARQLLKHYDYVGVIQVLEQVPPAYRSIELRDLLEKVTDLRDECEHLKRDIEEAVRAGDTETLPALVKRLLKLKPNNKAIKQLAADLKQYGAAKVIARCKGQRQFLDSNERVLETKQIVGSIALVAAVFVSVSLLVRNYLATSGPSDKMKSPEVVIQTPAPPVPPPKPPRISDEELSNEVDPGRRFARWVFDTKGEVELVSGEKHTGLSTLPQVPLAVRGVTLRNLTEVPAPIDAIVAQLNLIELKSDEHSAGVTVSLFNKSTATCQKLIFDKRVTDDQLAMLQGSQVLRSIELSDFYLPYSYTDRGIETVKRFPNLTRVAFAGGSINDASLKIISDLKSLEELKISGDTAVTDDGLAHLSQLTTLKSIDLGANRRIVGRGFQHLVGLPNLVTLFLLDMTLGDEAMPYLGRLSSTTILWLQNTKITDQRLDELNKLEKLWGLVISGTAVTDSGLDKLTVLGRLTNFDFTDSSLTDAGLKKLHGYKNLKKIDIRKTNVTAEGVRELQAALSDCKIFHDFDAAPGVATSAESPAKTMVSTATAQASVSGPIQFGKTIKGIPTNFEGGHVWRYSFAQPANIWTSLSPEADAEVKGWGIGRAGFSGYDGNAEGFGDRTRWVDKDHKTIWLRTTVDLPASITKARVIWDYFLDGNAEVLVNGTKEFEAKGFQTSRRTAKVDESHLKPGRNVICVSASQDGQSPSAFDLGFSWEPVLSGNNSPDSTAATVTVVDPPASATVRPHVDGNSSWDSAIGVWENKDKAPKVFTHIEVQRQFNKWYFRSTLLSGKMADWNEFVPGKPPQEHMALCTFPSNGVTSRITFQRKADSIDTIWTRVESNNRTTVTARGEFVRAVK